MRERVKERKREEEKTRAQGIILCEIEKGKRGRRSYNNGGKDRHMNMMRVNKLKERESERVSEREGLHEVDNKRERERERG